MHHHYCVLQKFTRLPHYHCIFLDRPVAERTCHSICNPYLPCLCTSGTDNHGYLAKLGKCMYKGAAHMYLIPNNSYRVVNSHIVKLSSMGDVTNSLSTFTSDMDQKSLTCDDNAC